MPTPDNLHPSPEVTLFTAPGSVLPNGEQGSVMPAATQTNDQFLPDIKGGGSEDTGLLETRYTPEELRAAQEGWLERRGVEPASVPRLTMDPSAFAVFRNAPPDYVGYVREAYGLKPKPKSDDQDNCQYALVDVVPGPDRPPRTELVIVNKYDFGTTIDVETIRKDFPADLVPDPQNPPVPESGGALRTVDIGGTLYDSRQDLEVFVEGLMRGQVVNPFSRDQGEDIGVRAGELAAGQKDAYVRTITPFTHAVELTIAFPGEYDSVCVVRGQMRAAANGKPGMAQIENPTQTFAIRGENLRWLQKIYNDLYHEPNFALTNQQRRERDELFNDYVVTLISHEASKNRAAEQARQDDETSRAAQQPLRSREARPS